jgi:SAM-dependent methyltransferase
MPTDSQLPAEGISAADAGEPVLARSYSRPLYRVKEAVMGALPWAAGVWQFNRQRRNAWVAERAAALPAGSRVIDVGAGSCPYRALFAHCTYVAHDVGKVDADLLQGRSGYGDLHLVSDITAIPTESGSFDAVLCTEVIEHVPDPTAAVAEMGRLLRPGGRLFLTAPLRSGLHQLPYHFYGGFTPEWYHRYLAQVGFDRIEVRPVCGAFAFYAEEGLRISLLLSPFSSAPVALRLLLLPVWLITVPWLAVLAPVLLMILDRLLPDAGGTTGYLVDAVRVDG